MTKIHYDELPVKNIIVSNLDEAINNLVKLKTMYSNMDIPGSFVNKNDLVNFGGDIFNYYNKILSINNMFKNSSKKLENLSFLIENKIDILSRNQVMMRDNVIK